MASTEARAQDRLVEKQATSENGPINILRIVAAIVVVLGHSRTLLFVDYDDAPHNIVQTMFYGVTVLGHQAVVVFFVLSGYWVGGSAHRKISQKTFSWRPYLLDRMIRLWVVLIPTLVLTLLLDLTGRHFFGSMTTYVGDPNYGGVVPEEQRPLDAVTFAGNILFLGHIRTETLGSNASLWSLSYEFWMYIIGPLVVMAVLSRGIRALLYAVLAVIGCLFVGHQVFMYLPIWILGAVVAVLRPRLDNFWQNTSNLKLATFRFVAGLLVVGAAIAVRGLNSLPMFVGDYLVAIPAAILLATLTTGFIKPQSENNILGTFSRLANSSYSLYAIHVPILILVVSVMGIEANNRWPSDLLHWFFLLMIVAAMTVFGWLFAQITEKHTNRVRHFARSALRVK